MQTYSVMVSPSRRQWRTVSREFVVATIRWPVESLQTFSAVARTADIDLEGVLLCGERICETRIDLGVDLFGWGGKGWLGDGVRIRGSEMG